MSRIDCGAEFQRCAVSVTLEVSRGGETRWFVTRESGEFPRCGDPEGCGCAGKRGGEWRRRPLMAYAVLKFGLASEEWRRRPFGEVLIAPLRRDTLGVLLSVGESMRKGRERDECMDTSWWSKQLSVSLQSGRLGSGEECSCDMYEKKAHGKCVLCRKLQSGGTDVRWIGRSSYTCSEKLAKDFVWFNGVTDAVGDVELVDGRSLLWLSCATRE
jgi:hypothetical protein